jgi:PEP-CTERM motif
MTTDALAPDTVATPVPEPSTLLPIGTGLAGAWSRTRWFGRKSA